MTATEPRQEASGRPKTVFLALASSKKTRLLALTSSFAVIYATLRIVPSFPIVAVPGAFFSSSDILVPLYGIILGPIFGAAAVILGTYLGIMFGKPFVPFFFGFDFMPAAIGAISVGFLARGKRYPVIVIFLVVLAMFLIHPFTVVLVNLPFGSVPYNWLHFTALILLLSPLSKKASFWINSGLTSQIARGLVIVALIGTMVQHLVGGIFYETGFPLIQPGKYNKEFFAVQWTIIFSLYPVERVILVIASVFLGIPLLRNLKVAGLDKKYIR
ncbi:MAG: hypothetical protein HYY67_04805 [Thaumarchaeota archaeon]|nr:hypothetical protein [Nitrososphaerota archaeon]